jgi:hypothetical protein
MTMTDQGLRPTGVDPVVAGVAAGAFADELSVPYSAGDYEDGNALAGPLSEIFAVDITAAEGHCTNCGSTGPVARLRVYASGPGMVARCPECGQVVMRFVRTTDSAWLDMRGTVSLRIRLDG